MSLLRQKLEVHWSRDFAQTYCKSCDCKIHSGDRALRVFPNSKNKKVLRAWYSSDFYHWRCWSRCVAYRTASIVLFATVAFWMVFQWVK